MVQSVQLPHYSWTSLNNYIFQSGTTHKMIFQRKKPKKEMKKFKNDWSFIVQGFILLRTNRYCTVLMVTFDERKICFDWIVIDYVKSMSYNFRIFQENCVWTFSLFTTVFGGLIRSTWIIWDLYVCKLKNDF